jgi:hypothetical protein
MHHLVIIQNGLHGLWRAMKPVKYALETMNGGMKNCDIHISTVNDLIMTRDGVEACGTRLVDFIENIIVTGALNNTSYNSISFITHSFGGLIARYAIGILYEKKIFDHIQPLMFVSIATPHLGILNSGQLIIHKIVNFSATYLAGQTGKELMLLDDTQILTKISSVGTKYMDGLQLFARKYTYSNVNGDSLVSFETSSICLHECDKMSIGHYLFNIVDTNLNPSIVSEKNKKIYDHLMTIDWIKRAVNLEEYYNIHRAIIGNTVIPFIPSLFSPDYTDKKYIVIGDIVKEFNQICIHTETNV